MKKLELAVKNKANNYRVLLIEPLGLKFGMDPGEKFTLQVITNNFQMSIYDDSKEIVFTFKNYEHLETKLFSQDEEILTGYNILFI
jgi:hypothetical protein